MIFFRLLENLLYRMSTIPVNIPDCEVVTAELLAATRSLFDAAVEGKTINSAARDQIAYRFHSLLEEYMRAEKGNAIGTFHNYFDTLKDFVQNIRAKLTSY